MWRPLYAEPVVLVIQLQTKLSPPCHVAGVDDYSDGNCWRVCFILKHWDKS